MQSSGRFSSVPKILESLANLAIVVVACLLAVVLLRTYVLNRPAPAAPAIATGSRVLLDGVADKTNPTRHLVLALSTQCHFCTESGPFYKRILQTVAGQNNVKVLAVFPQSPTEGTMYLKGLDADIADVRHVDFGTLHVRATPTLILVSPAGTAERVWVGKLPPEKEQEVLAAVTGQATSSTAGPSGNLAAK